MRKFIIPIFILWFSIFCTGCSSISVDESLIQKYKEHNRINKYYELKEEYDNNLLILLLNSEEDHPIVNSLLWFFSFFIPDIPEACATGGVVAIMYFVAWWIGVTLCGGGILAVLAYLGGMCGGIPGIPPAILGIVFLGLMFSILSGGCRAIMAG